MKILWIATLMSMVGSWVLAVEKPKTETIQWAMTDFPPFILLSSDGANVDIQKSQGPFAEIYRELVRSLPQYEHKFVRASFLRAERLFLSHRHFCTLLLQDTPARSHYLIFGAEVARALPIGLVMSPGSYSKFQQYETADGMELTKLVQAGDFRLGVVQGRSYSNQIDRLIVRAKDSYRHVSDQAVGGLFVMLEKNRLDGVLSYYLEEWDHRKGREAGALKYLAVKEAPAYISVRASCEKTPWGESTIKEISKVVEEKNVRSRIYDYFQKSLPKEMRGKVREIYRGLLP
ncbi:TIGR02285 family protein [Bdellovibrio bacteriovorus]|uniref:TIGR02285 family protein n=1 Tax=Bdellovibrio bacteriovorus TaxID=959 RepID=UPI0021D0C3C1|nr:TIGR02285 family protein [Bdellovibrio bacteriovorus]UXR65174.1 TIGR02285 family protein [Bdellovibrio bacteriovorus]